MGLQRVKIRRCSVRCIEIRNHLITILTEPEERNTSGVSCAHAATHWVTFTHLGTSSRAGHTGPRFLNPIKPVPASLAPSLADSIRTPSAGGLAMGVPSSKPRAAPALQKCRQSLLVKFEQGKTAAKQGRIARPGDLGQPALYAMSRLTQSTMVI